jgi:hypothetical protein
MSITVYHFKLQPSLKNLGLFADLAHDTLLPQSLGILVVIALLYLTWRLIYFIPMYQHSADKSFDVFFEKLEGRDHRIKEKITEKIEALNSIDVAAIKDAIENMEEKRRETFDGIKDFENTLSSAFNEFNSNIDNIKEKISRLGSEIDKLNDRSPASALDSWRAEFGRQLGFRNIIDEPFFEATQDVRLLQKKLGDIGPLSLSYEPSEVQEKLERLQKAMDVEYDDFIDKSKIAREAANREARIFGVWVPSVVSGIGLAFGFSTIYQTEGLLCPILGTCLFTPFIWYILHRHGYKKT